MGQRIVVVVIIISTLLLATITPLRSFTLTTASWNWFIAADNGKRQSHPCSAAAADRRTWTNQLSRAMLRRPHVDQRCRRRAGNSYNYNNNNDRTGTTTELNCICINCAYVTNCTIYHFVETQHEQPHLTLSPTFTPRRGSPRMHVTTKPPTEHEWAKFWQTEEGVASEAEARAAAELDKSTDDGKVRVAMTALPMSTTEYDIVKCEDFILDQGIWIRNMPEEIRRVNPDFVPT